MSNFGEVLKNLRKNANMTQKELANVLWLSKSAISCYEQDTRFPSPEMLIKIANVFHVSTDYLLGREQKMKVLDITDLAGEDVEFLNTTLRFLREKNRGDDKTALSEKEKLRRAEDSSADFIKNKTNPGGSTMGLFTKKVNCAKCGAEFEKGMLSDAKLCPRCTLEETENNILAKNTQAFLQGFEKYYKEMPAKFKNANVDLRAALQSRDQIIRKYADDPFKDEEIDEAAANYDQMSDDECKVFAARLRSALLYNQGFSTLSNYFILSHAYPGLILDFDSVFAAAYKPINNFMINTNAKEQAYEFCFFTNDPFVPALGITIVIGSTLGLFSLGSDKRNREDSAKSMLTALCPNLTYPVVNIKDLKKQVKSEGTVKGNIAPDFMAALIDLAEKEKGFFSDISGVQRELYVGMEILMSRNGFFTTEEASDSIKTMFDKNALKFWKPYFANESPLLIYNLGL